MDKQFCFFCKRSPISKIDYLPPLINATYPDLHPEFSIIQRIIFTHTIYLSVMRHCKREIYNTEWHIHTITWQQIVWNSRFNEINITIKRVLRDNFIASINIRIEVQLFHLYCELKCSGPRFALHKIYGWLVAFYFPIMKMKTIVLQSLNALLFWIFRT